MFCWAFMVERLLPVKGAGRIDGHNPIQGLLEDLPKKRKKSTNPENPTFRDYTRLHFKKTLTLIPVLIQQPIITDVPTTVPVLQHKPTYCR